MFRIRKHALHGKAIPDTHREARKVIMWVSTNGKEKALADLDKNHLQNIVNKIGRGEFSEDIKLQFLEHLNNELTFRINNPNE